MDDARCDLRACRDPREFLTFQRKQKERSFCFSNHLTLDLERNSKNSEASFPGGLGGWPPMRKSNSRIPRTPRNSRISSNTPGAIILGPRSV